MLAVAVVAPALASPAAAQGRGREARGFVAIGGGLQALAAEFSNDAVFPGSGDIYSAAPRGLLSEAAAREQARLSARHALAAAPGFDAGAGIRVAGSFALGVAASYASRKAEAAVSARVPHPFFFTRDRQVSGLAAGLSRKEIGIHMQAQLLLAASESVMVTLFGGPSLINLTEDLVADVRFRQHYPFETASYDEALTQAQSGSGIGFNAGADLAYYFSDVAGVGVLVRYSRATVDLPSAGGGTVGVPAGGLHVNGGLRVQF